MYGGARLPTPQAGIGRLRVVLKSMRPTSMGQNVSAISSSNDAGNAFLL
jgi:hypothetical protein